MVLFQSLLQKVDDDLDGKGINSNTGDSQLDCKNGLLNGYNIYLVGDFHDITSIHDDHNEEYNSDDDDYDTISINDNTNKKNQNQKIDEEKGKTKGKTNDDTKFTKGRICLLLQLCGANVYDIQSSKSIQLSKMSSNTTNPTTSVSVIVSDSKHLSLEIKQYIKNVIKRTKKKQRKKKKRNNKSNINSSSTRSSSIDENNDDENSYSINSNGGIPIVHVQWMCDSIKEFRKVYPYDKINDDSYNISLRVTNCQPVEYL